MSSRWSLLVIFVVGLICISPLPERAVKMSVSGHSGAAGKAPAQPKPEAVAKSPESRAGGQTPGATPPAEQSNGGEMDGLPSASRTLVLLLEKLGEALIIAAVLGWAVDEAVKRSLVTEITRDVVNFAVGFELPPEVKEKVLFVLRLPFVRRNVRMNYQFTPAPNVTSPQYLEVLSTAEYEVTNLTESAKYFDFKSTIEVRRGEGLPDNRLLLMEVPAQKRSVTDPELDAISYVEAPYRKAKLPVEIGGRGSGPVTFRTKRLAYYRLNDAIVLDILEPPCIGISVSVVAPPELHFDVSFGSAGEVEVKQLDGGPQWEHPGVHLPGSHFRIQWEYQRQDTNGAPGQSA